MIKYNLSQFLDRSFKTEDYEWFNKMCASLDIREDGPWLCGGAVRNVVTGTKHDSDWDLFFKSYDQLKKWLHIQRDKIIFKYETDNQATYEYKHAEKTHIVQIIKVRFYNNIEEVLDSFDYTICMLGVNGTNTLYCGDYTLWDLSRKRLVLHKLMYPVATIRRMLKYGGKGFFVCNGLIGSILENCKNNPELLNNKIEYLD
jgi:hypothetical protein